MSTTINRAGWLVAGVLALFVVAAMTGVVRGGPLDPPGAPSATGTLPQVEPRSPIPPVGWNGAFPIVISQPGSYHLTRSLTGVASTDGIQVTADNVSVDLSGFTLAGFNKTGSGIAVVGTHSGIRISNGVVRNWNKGIDGYSLGREAVYSGVDHITALDNADTGISVGSYSEITDCHASLNVYGIATHYSVVRRCHATNNTSYGIWVQDRSLIEDSVASNNGLGIVLDVGATPGESAVRSSAATHNASWDFRFYGTNHVGDSNLATCPQSVGGSGVTIYNARFERPVC